MAEAIFRDMVEKEGLSGKILIDADNSSGVVIRGKRDSKGNVERYAVIKNYGNIRVRGRGTYGVSYKDISAADLAALEAIVNSKLTSDPKGQELKAATVKSDFIKKARDKGIIVKELGGRY